MSKAWTDKKEYQLLAGELATSEGRDFERLSLPLIRIIWSETITPTAMGSYDRIGADHLVARRVVPAFNAIRQTLFLVGVEQRGFVDFPQVGFQGRLDRIRPLPCCARHEDSSRVYDLPRNPEQAYVKGTANASPLAESESALLVNMRLPGPGSFPQ